MEVREIQNVQPKEINQDSLSESKSERRDRHYTEDGEQEAKQLEKERQFEPLKPRSEVYDFTLDEMNQNDEPPVIAPPKQTQGMVPDKF